HRRPVGRRGHTSARNLERAFLRDTGLTLRQWRLHNRMKAASSLLGNGASIASVGRRVGYTSTSSFTRAFRTHFGTTPSQHRRQSPPPRIPTPSRRRTEPCDDRPQPPEHTACVPVGAAERRRTPRLSARRTVGGTSVRTGPDRGLRRP